MEGVMVSLILVVGLLLRIALPLALTVLLVVALKRLDARWQAEAESQGASVEVPGNPGCWEANQCSVEKRESCQAYAHPETPCWQLFRDKDGCLEQKCLVCKVFRSAPTPVPAHVRA